MSTIFDLTNVINVTLVPQARGLTAFKTANLLILSTDTPLSSFGSATYGVYRNSTSVIKDWGTGTLTSNMAASVFSQQPNILNADGALIIAPKQTGETIEEALIRLNSEVLFCGFITTDSIENDISEINDTANFVQSVQNKIQAIVSNSITDISGAFKTIKDANYTKTRCLYYGSLEEKEAKIFMAAYMSKYLSTNFTGSDTTQTMHLKPLAGILPDPVIDQTNLDLCTQNGVDVYISIEGVPIVFTSGANGWADEVLNELWFVNALQVAGFNWLATTNTKIPQTETGMTELKGEYVKVCSQAVRNGFLAPGTWNSPDTFGDPAIFRQNISNSGYYVYSQPITEQSQSDREARIAPICQIACKAAGAIHKTNIMIYVNL